jgi:hypothetical protein
MLLEMTGALEHRRARLLRDDRVKPVLLVAVPDGGVRFLDRSQRIYTIDPTSPKQFSSLAWSRRSAELRRWWRSPPRSKGPGSSAA